MSAANRAARRGVSTTTTGKHASRAVPFDPADYLIGEEDVAGFLSESISDGRMDEILHSFFTACRARGIGKMARASGLGRESL